MSLTSLLRDDLHVSSSSSTEELAGTPGTSNPSVHSALCDPFRLCVRRFVLLEVAFLFAAVAKRDVFPVSVATRGEEMVRPTRPAPIAYSGPS
jgi:hypothetical protein